MARGTRRQKGEARREKRGCKTFRYGVRDEWRNYWWEGGRRDGGRGEKEGLELG